MYRQRNRARGKTGEQLSAFDSLDTSIFMLGLFKNNSSYNDFAVEITDGTNTAEIGFNSGASDDGNYWISSADVGSSGVTPYNTYYYHVSKWKCQKTGIIFTQRNFSLTTNPIVLTLNDAISGKPSIIFPGAGNNCLYDASADAIFDDLFDAGGTFLVHACNTTASTSNRRLWSKGAGNAYYHTSHTSLRLLRDLSTTDRGMGHSLTNGQDNWNAIVVNYHESNQTGQYSVNGDAFADLTVNVAGSGTRVSDAGTSFCIGAGTSAASGHAYGGGMTTVAGWDTLLS